MSGTKKSPIEILRDDLEAMRKRVCDLSTQHQNLSEELTRAQGEHRERLQTVQRQMEQRAAAQQQVLSSLQSELKSTAEQHRRHLDNQRQQFVSQMAELERESDKKFDSLRNWTQENLDRQRTEYLRLSIEHQKQTNQLKMQIEQMSHREQNRDTLAADYLHDLEVLIESAEQNLPHQKFAPGKLERIRLQLEAARQRLREDMSSAAVAGVQQALFDLMDLEEEVMRRELEFEMVYGTALKSVDGLFAAVRRNRLVSVADDTPLQEVDYWTSGRFQAIEQNISDLKNRLETEKSRLSIADVQQIIEATSDCSSQQEDLIKEAVERIISAQIRAEMGDTIVESLQQQGFRITMQDECGYFEQDQRQSYVVNMRNLSGTRVVSVITPDEQTHQNTLSVNTYDDPFYNEAVLQLRSEEILQALRNANLKTGATECAEAPEEKFYNTHDRLRKKPVNTNPQKTTQDSSNVGAVTTEINQ